MCSMYHALPPKKRCRIRNVRLLPHPPGAEFGFKLPGLAVRLQRFARPAERIWRDVGKGIVPGGTHGNGTPIRWIFTDITPYSFRWTGEALEPDGHTWQRGGG